MRLRSAEAGDLPGLKAMYGKIIEHMEKNGIRIWDDVYPCCLFQDDMENRRLYILDDGESTVAAFALCEGDDGADCVGWEKPGGRALYLGRLGVNVAYLRQGAGSLALRYAMDLARRKNAEYLRLFVADTNNPAINLYMSSGFTRAEGIYELEAGDFALSEYGFEIKLCGP